MKNKLFRTVKSLNPKRNLFDLSHEKKLTAKFGVLTPVFLAETLPSDKWKLNSESLIRFHPLASPVMARFNVYFHYWFVPMYLIWDNWHKFITGGEDGKDTTAFPQILVNESIKDLFPKGGLADYFGIPPQATKTITTPFNVNALPFRAYQLIYNEWYRDQNLQGKNAFSTGDTLNPGDEISLTTLNYRNWPHDYFTAGLPWAQKGDEVLMPYDITYKDPAIIVNGGLPDVNSGALNEGPNGVFRNFSNSEVGIDNIESMNISINDFRKSLRLQQWLERNARSGSRLAETILSHFSVQTDDLRLGRPKYLGGGKQPVSVSEVLSAFGNDEIMPLGEMGGHGISVGNTNQFRYFCKDHGYIIGLMSVLPERSYMDGLDRIWTKNDKFDFAWPEFAHLGEQEILNQEIYLNTGAGAQNSATWGYQSRYADLKYMKNSIHGDFRDNLSMWHAGSMFSGLPGLNAQFIKADMTDIENRIFAVSDNGASQKIYCNIYHNCQAIRPLPVFGTPTI